MAFNVNDSDGLVLADIRALLAIIACAATAAGKLDIADAHAAFLKFMKERASS